jgi:hypothetical protein
MGMPLHPKTRVLYDALLAGDEGVVSEHVAKLAADPLARLSPNWKPFLAGRWLHSPIARAGCASCCGEAPCHTDTLH